MFRKLFYDFFAIVSKAFQQRWKWFYTLGLSVLGFVVKAIGAGNGCRKSVNLDWWKAEVTLKKVKFNKTSEFKKVLRIGYFFMVYKNKL